MPLFGRTPRISPDFIAVPAEPSRAELEPQTIDRSVVIAAFDRLVYHCQQQGRMDLADRVLDERDKVKPVRRAEVPVIPGRPS